MNHAVHFSLFSALALLSLRTPASAQAGVVGWGEMVTHTAWSTDRYLAIAAGTQHTVAVRTDGTVVAWGDNRGNEPDQASGQCSDIPPLPRGLSYVQVAAGLKHSVALRSDGRIVVWGDRHYPLQPSQSLPCVEISAGSYSTLARFSDGSVTVTGVDEPPVPSLPAGVTYVEIAAGGRHNVARRSDGVVVVWGKDNSFGQLDLPVLPAGLTYVEIAAGLEHSVARRSDGAVIAWGNNGRGQCDTPAPPVGLSYTDVEAGGIWTLARRSDGSAVAWGDNSFGQRDIPALPAGLTYVELAAGQTHGVARRSDGSVVCWAGNDRNQCNAAPVLPAGVSFRQITANRIALLSDGSIVVWLTGGGIQNPIRAVPALPAGVSYTEVASSANSPWAMARRTDGAVVVWGFTSFGQELVPALPAGLSYVEIAASPLHGLARRSDGSVVAWGRNTDGECDVPALPIGVTYTQIAANEGSSAACRSDGTSVVWGLFGSGESAPRDGLSYVEVAMSRWHSVFRRSDGVVVGCGGDIACPFPPPPAGLSYVELAAAQLYPEWFHLNTYAVSVARLSDGSVFSWGTGASYPNDQHLPRLPSGFSYAGIAAAPGVTYGLIAPTRIPLAPEIARVTPTTIEALLPGTNPTVALDGTGLDLVTTVLLDDVAIAPARYRIVSSALILLDMPQTASLGAHEITVSDGAVDVSMNVTVVAPATPKYELGTGDALNPVERRDGLSYIVAGPVGSVQRVYVSLSDRPSTSPYGNLAIGDQFASLFFVGQYAIPAAGWLRVTTPAAALPLPGLAGIVFYSQTLELTGPAPFRASNLQSIELVERAGSVRRQ